VFKINRLVKCKECKEYIQEHIYKKHQHSMCMKRLCGCPNSVTGCIEIVRFIDLDRHVKLRCKLRLVSCRLHCGARVPIKSLLDHEENHCCKRKIICGICDDLVVSQDLASHRHQECLNRLVKCRVGCGILLLAKDREHHEIEVRSFFLLIFFLFFSYFFHLS